MEDYQSYFQLLGHDLGENDIDEWLQADASDRGYEHLCDEEIVASVTHDPASQEHYSDEETETTEPGTTHDTASISHGQAVKMFDSCITWLQVQDEASPHNLSMLRELHVREIAAKKRLSNLTQECMTDYMYFSVQDL